MGWLVYFSQYFGRYNYAAAMVAVGQKQGWDTAQLGLIASIIFITYGFGQLFTGWLGDRLNPKAMIFAGCAGSAGCNLWMGLSGSLLQMRLAWGINGLFCALIWAPMVRLMTVYMPEERLRKAILSFTYATSLGITGTYLLTSFLVSRFDWRVAFIVPAVIGMTASLGWLAISFTSGKTPAPTPPVPAGTSLPSENAARSRGSLRSLYIRSGLPLLLAAILLMGLLKDGMMTWVPQMITDTFQVEAYLSIFLSAALPLVNSLAVWLVKRIGRGHEQDDMRSGALLFLGAVAVMGMLLLLGGLHPVLSVALFSVISTFITGTNVILISFVPLQFTAMGRTSTIAGLTNAFTYLGSALSGWGLGWIAGHYGWGVVNWVLLALCLLGAVICLAARPLWSRFTQENASDPG